MTSTFYEKLGTNKMRDKPVHRNYLENGITDTGGTTMNPKSTRKYWLLTLTILIGLGLDLALPTLAIAHRAANSERLTKHPLEGYL